MDTIAIPKSSRRWDVLSLVEVMLRLDPGESRIRTTRQFQIWEGGGEYNVARGLRRCFGLRAGIVTALGIILWAGWLKISFCRAALMFR